MFSFPSMRVENLDKYVSDLPTSEDYKRLRKEVSFVYSLYFLYVILLMTFRMVGKQSQHCP